VSLFVIAAIILAAMFLVAALCGAAGDADRAIEAHRDQRASMGDELDAIVIQFPERP
jgi:hypothetical protein